MKKKGSTKIQLTPQEFKDFQGACAIAALNVQAIQQQVMKQIEVAQQDKQKEFLNLVRKYRSEGMRADKNYSFDVETHSLVEAK